jgi:hypothetical protein
MQLKEEIEKIANSLLENDSKPNYSKRDFMNILIIFNSALMDKMYDLQNEENISNQDRLKMAEKCGFDLHKLIHTYTNLNTHKIEEFI